MKNNELITTGSAFGKLQDFDLSLALSDELAGLSSSFERIKIPAAGSTVFEVPGEDPDSPEAVKEFSAVILHHHPLNAFYLACINTATGRIHPDLMPLATQTGRFAARHPNLQTCPRKGNDPIGVRSFIVAPENVVILSLDFSQIELRVGAFYCRDNRMLETYRTGGDIHAQTTSVIFGIPFAQAIDKHAPDYKERRTIAKNCNFGVFYGLFAAGLQRTLRFKAGLEMMKEQCGEIIRNLKAGYPGLAKWQEREKLSLRNNCFTQTWLGRRRYLFGIRSQDWGKRSFAERCALNTPIQGTAAEILKLACGRILAGLPQMPWLKPLLQIHDELVFEVPVDKLEESVRFIKACMEAQPFPAFDVPIEAEAAAGRNFGELEELEGLA